MSALNLGAVCAQLTGKGMMSSAEISSRATCEVKRPGIYFLLRAGRVVYVGQSENVLGRAVCHLPSVTWNRPGDKVFDSVAYYFCRREHLDILESVYIHALQPEYNGGMSRGRKLRAPLSIDDLKRISSEGEQRAGSGA